MRLDYRLWDASCNKDIYLFRLTASDGTYIELSNWGATWVAASMPDGLGCCSDVLLGYPTLSGYMTDTSYLGATIGRYANRLSGASITVDGIKYHLEANDGENTNHGGIHGWHRRIWSWCEIPSGIRFTLFSPHLEGGFPGDVQVAVDYCLTDDHCVTIKHRAETSAPTHVCMTNHAYFNLSGRMQSVDDHLLRIFSTKMLETDIAFIPTGKIIPVLSTPFDFTTAHAIGEYRHLTDIQLKWNRGYNHCYVLEDTCGLKPAAVLTHLQSRRKLTVSTTLPSVLFYSAGYLQSESIGKQGGRLIPDTGVCLETQFYPDSPAHDSFPSTLLRVGDIYEHITKYKFETI